MKTGTELSAVGSERALGTEMGAQSFPFSTGPWGSLARRFLCAVSEMPQDGTARARLSRRRTWPVLTAARRGRLVAGHKGAVFAHF